MEEKKKWDDFFNSAVAYSLKTIETETPTDEPSVPDEK